MKTKKSLRSLVENKVSSILKEEFGDGDNKWKMTSFKNGKYWNSWSYSEDQLPEMLEHLNELLGLDFQVQLTEDGEPVNYNERWPDFFAEPDLVDRFVMDKSWNSASD